ncbi:MAG: hypothetical protein CR986_09135 [Ignavibacteriae bacterium]|nr:MAG: hypothetical protein CR986_09135 [Ignavibacteriota bacterium]
MKITNVHQREYNYPISKLSKILETLSTEKDLMWPKENWVPVILDNGLRVNSSGGHGRIRYYITKYEYGKLVEFCFTEPKEFVGKHYFELKKLNENKTKVKHTIDVELNLKGLILWNLIIKWLHDALLEDCLDKIENNLEKTNVKTPHNAWVKFLRKAFRKNKKNT